MQISETVRGRQKLKFKVPKINNKVQLRQNSAILRLIYCSKKQTVMQVSFCNIHEDTSLVESKSLSKGRSDISFLFQISKAFLTTNFGTREKIQ